MNKVQILVIEDEITVGSGTEQSVPGPVFYEGSGCKSQSVFSPLYDRGKKCAIIIFEIFKSRRRK